MKMDINTINAEKSTYYRLKWLVNPVNRDTWSQLICDRWHADANIVKFSKENSKMGHVHSVSLPPILTCREDAPCKGYCYAVSTYLYSKHAHNAWDNNYSVLCHKPHSYFQQIDDYISREHCKLFRWHVSGDMCYRTECFGRVQWHEHDLFYWANVLDIARKHPNTQFLIFTKLYDILAYNADNMPDNLHPVLSAVRGLDMDNPGNLPVAGIHYLDGFSSAPDSATECNGCCEQCSKIHGGCWDMGRGESVYFNVHGAFKGNGGK